MKKVLLTAPLAVLCFYLIGFLQGCVKDSYQRTYTYTYYKPVYKTTAEVRANIKSNASQQIERPGKLYLYGKYIFLNEVDKGVHVIDNTNPSSPQNIGFINIPGNMDIAVKENTLYADLYTDLVAIDITDPHNVVLKKVVEDVFPHRYYNGYFTPDSTRVIASWEKRDTTIVEKSEVDNWWRSNGGIFFAQFDSRGGALANAGKNASAAPYGIGGSMARFTITSNRLYTVGYSDLDVFNITNATDPVHTARKNMGWNIETIYPFMGKLFIGSQNGMFIYNISNPDNPVQTGQFGHVRSCDPVIADNKYAYVTLRSGSLCQGFTNELDILQLNNFTDPSLLKVYNLTNPHGLSKDGNTLFICDGQAGLKIYNAADVMNLQMIKHMAGPDTYDVIAWNGNALVVAKDGLYQYDYSNLADIRLLSKINVSN
jgi:hypothetical protein